MEIGTLLGSPSCFMPVPWVGPRGVIEARGTGLGHAGSPCPEASCPLSGGQEVTSLGLPAFKFTSLLCEYRPPLGPRGEGH